MRPGVFLDRDGTIIRNVHHLACPSGVELLAGAAEALRLLRGAGFACVLVSNQSAVGRGLLSPAGLESIHQELCRQLERNDACLDGWYFCPEVPRSDDRLVIEHVDRKPGPGMLLRAAADLGLDLKRSWMIGDMISDIAAGRNAGCKGSILVRTGEGARASGAADLASHVADNVLDAARWILAQPETSARAVAATDLSAACNGLGLVPKTNGNSTP